MPDTQTALKLIYRANIFVVNITHLTLRMGRDDSNEIVVASLFASKLHARAEASNGQFVLTDLSSNGTFVLLDEQSDTPSDTHNGVQSEANSAERRLRQEEMALSGRGWLGMGRSASKHGEHSVRFSVQAEIG